jgi:hypothetical protein
MAHDHFGQRVERRYGELIARFDQLDRHLGTGGAGRTMSVD